MIKRTLYRAACLVLMPFLPFIAFLDIWPEYWDSFKDYCDVAYRAFLKGSRL